MDTFSTIVACLAIALIVALVAYKWGWKGGLILVALGVVAIVGIWAIMSLLHYREVETEHRFTNAAIFVMVAWPAIIVWLAFAGLGAVAGMFVRIFIARKSA